MTTDRIRDLIRQVDEQIAAERAAAGEPSPPPAAPPLITDEQISTIVRNVQTRLGVYHPEPDPAPAPEEEARQDALAALERQEQRSRDAQAARALLRERWGDAINVSALSDADALREAGIELTEEQRTARDLAAYDARAMTDPAFFTQETAKVEARQLQDQWFTLPARDREQKARDLGLDVQQVHQAAITESNRRRGY